MNRILPVLGALAALVVVLIWPACSTPSDPDRPNIVLILADDMRADDLEHTPKTRALLADEGLTFENAFVTNSLCVLREPRSYGVNTPTTTGSGTTNRPSAADRSSATGASNTPPWRSGSTVRDTRPPWWAST